MKNLCSNNCPHGKDRETCVELCAEALAYADQDHIGREQAFNISGLGRWSGAIRFKHPYTQSVAREIRALQSMGKTVEEISIHLECDEDFIREILNED